MAKATNPETRKLLDAAKELGFTPDESLDGRGHIVLRHENGETFRISSSPSDWRGSRNAISAMERISGRKLHRHTKNRSRKPTDIAGYTRTVRTQSAVAWSLRIEELLEEHISLMLEFRILSMGEPTRTEINRMMSVIRRLSEIEDFLIELRQPLPEENVAKLKRAI